MKKWILAVTMFFVMLSSAVYAEEAEKYESGDYKYILLEDGTAEISAYTGEDEELEVPSELDGYVVTSIGESSFLFCINLKKLILPECVTRIGNRAFFGCGKLESITFPVGLKVLGDYSFVSCKSLSNISLPDNIESIGANPFEWSDLTITISPDHPYLAVIDDVLFSKPDKRLVYCPTSKTTYEVPKGIQIIGEAAFNECKSLTNIKLSDSVTSIEAYAFEGCTHISSIILPDNVNSIGVNPFESTIITVKLSPDHPYLAVIDGALFIKPDKTLVYCPCLKESFVVPDGIQTIGDNAFSGCFKLRDITLPQSVLYIGKHAFDSCAIKSITIPENVDQISGYTFRMCNDLTNIMLSDNLEGIGDGAFFGCSSLKSITIPANVSSMGRDVFTGCKEITVTVERDSYAAEYCKENSLTYTYPDANDWLNG